jgi:multimeric flavodoxin WrbA
MKVALFCGSANRNGNTATAMKEIMRGLAYKGIETELLYLAFAYKSLLSFTDYP